MIKKAVLEKALRLVCESVSSAFKEDTADGLYNAFIKKAELELKK